MTAGAATYSVTVNGAKTPVFAPPSRRLSEVLREDIGLRGTKVGCDAGDCGACSVLLDGQPVCACLTTLAQAAGRDLVTVEGLPSAGFANLQQSFLRYGAAQCGICTPGMLISAAALLQQKPQPTESDVQDALGGVLCRCTGYARIVQAVMNANQPLPDPADPAGGAAIGAAVDRLDGGPKVAGTEVFGADFWPGDALLVRAVRSPHHAADFTFGDREKWRGANPGILLVLTAADIPGENKFGTIPAFVDQPALAESPARLKGEAVALIVGEPDAVAGADLDRFPVIWHERSPLLETEVAKSEPADRVHAERPGNLLISGLVRFGDVETALRNSAYTASAQVKTAYVEHAYIEPEAGVAWLDGDTLVIQTCTQAPVMDQEETAKILGLPKDRVRIIPAAAGGGFGAKLDISLQPLIGLAAIKTGRPCRMVYSRAESMMSTTKRHPSNMTATIGCDAGGMVTAMQFDGDFNTGAYASWGPTVANRVPVHASGPYVTPAYYAKADAIHTNGPTAGAFRGFGVPQGAIIQEILYDDLALACGVDRLAFRAQNAFVDGSRTPTGQIIQGVGIAECLAALQDPWHAAGAEIADWNVANPDHPRGIGVASCWYGCGNTSLPNPSTILAGIKPDGTLVLHQGATDIGQGANTVIAQIFADALGMALRHVTLVGPDTALTPDGGKTSASRQTYVSGKAAELCGKALRAAILRRTNMDDTAVLDLNGGALVAAQQGRKEQLDLSCLAPDANGYAISATETYDPPTLPLDENGQGVPYAVYGYGAQMAEVQVDIALGTVKVRHMHAAHDLGRVINPTLAIGQIEGGIAQGLGMALMEEYVPGRTENLHDYLIPTIGDMPKITSYLIEKPDPEGPFGAKGLGEHVLIPTAPAILNAIRHACGARITQLPALPFRVRAAIRKAGG